MDRPNLLYIHSDQHSPKVLGCYGDPLVKTPHLDGLAARGVMFKYAYCPSPVCTPSRMSMLTGRFPYENEVWANNHVLGSGRPTMAHAMGMAGYRPVLAGRMHALGTDQLHGYVDRPIGDHSSNYPGSGYTPENMIESVQRSGAGQSGYQVHDEDVTAVAIDFINRQGTKNLSGRMAHPFCLHVGYMLPHSPFIARREDYEQYSDVMIPPRHPKPMGDEGHPFYQWWRDCNRFQEVDEADALRARAAYWGLVTALDRMIGQLFEALERNGFADNTMIVYSSDHGEQVGEKGLWMKRTFYEDSVGVPALVSWPGILPEGEVSERVISALDLNATMLDALGAPELPHARGRSLLPLLRGETNRWEDVAFSEYCMYEGHYQRMIRQDDWKLIYHHKYDPQLFNMTDDPEELNDRAKDPDCQVVREELTAKVLDGWNPAWVAAKMEEKRRDMEIISGWASATVAPEQFKWPKTPDMTYLD